MAYLAEIREKAKPIRSKEKVIRKPRKNEVFRGFLSV